MAGPLPHTFQIQSLAEAFIDDVAAEIAKAHKQLKASAGFRKVYRISLAADCILSKLLRLSTRPPPHAARAIVKGVPLLVSTRQLGPAKIELRRFMELIVWDVYFSDHRIEWEAFRANPTHGFTRDEKDPVEYCAHRELDYYLNYAKARVAAEPSGIASEAVEELRLAKGWLNEAVHPGAGAGLTGSVVPLDVIDANALDHLAGLQRSVFASSCVLVASIRRRLFDRLPAMYRGHFDWLVGGQRAKKIRGGPFGL